MDTRLRNRNLEVAILHTLHRASPALARSIAISASPDGTVWLRGRLARREECETIKQSVSGVPGVTTVFCHIEATA